MSGNPFGLLCRTEPRRELSIYTFMLHLSKSTKQSAAASNYYALRIRLTSRSPPCLHQNFREKITSIAKIGKEETRKDNIFDTTATCQVKVSVGRT